MSCICAAGCPTQAPRGGILFLPLPDRAPAAACVEQALHKIGVFAEDALERQAGFGV